MVISLILLSALYQQTPILNFDQAKNTLIDSVYHDNMVTTYCGCDFERYARSGGRVDHDSCGYEIQGYRQDAEIRAARIEWEHIFPISRITEGRGCGTRANCRETDSHYRIIEGDMHNLTPIVGEVNAMRSNYIFQDIPHISFQDQFGQCNVKVDRGLRAVEPPDKQKGFIARTYQYVSWAYGVPLTREKQRTFIRWSNDYPVTEWELTRNERIGKIQGWENPFISGHETWDTVKDSFSANIGIYAQEELNEVDVNYDNDLPPYRGNRNSSIYFPKGCTWYDRIAPRNRVPFNSAAEAEGKGFRAARNC